MNNRKQFLSIIVLSFSASISHTLGASVKLAWNPSPSPDIQGYYVYCRRTDLSTVTRLNAGKQALYTVDNLTVGSNYRFWVTAYSQPDIESIPTAEVLYNVPGGTGGNTAPTLTTIANQTVDEDTSTSVLSFTVGDAQTAAGSLGVIGASSNPTLVPSGNIRFGGSGSLRYVTISPAPDRSGTATISISVSDGSLMTTRSFLLTVRAINDAPTISLISNQTTTGGAATTPISFAISDAETSASSLSVSASSSSSTLVPQANLILGGSGSNRTITVKPAPSQYGSATITLSVSDGALVTKKSFLYTSVSPVTTNTPPTISPIPNLTSYNGTATPPVTFKVSDAQSPPEILVVKADPSNETLVPVSNVIFGGSGSNRTISVKPAPGQYGTTRIYILCNDTKKTTIIHFEFFSVKTS